MGQCICPPLPPPFMAVSSAPQFPKTNHSVEIKAAWLLFALNRFLCLTAVELPGLISSVFCHFFLASLALQCVNWSLNIFSKPHCTASSENQTFFFLPGSAAYAQAHQHFNAISLIVCLEDVLSVLIAPTAVVFARRFRVFDAQLCGENGHLAFGRQQSAFIFAVECLHSYGGAAREPLGSFAVVRRARDESLIESGPHSALICLTSHRRLFFFFYFMNIVALPPCVAIHSEHVPREAHREDE